MSVTRHERPGVYSAYDASAAVSANRAARRIGVAAKASRGDTGEAEVVNSYTAGVSAFGEDAAGSEGMSTILNLLFANGASAVVAVRVADEGARSDYQAAFAALASEDVQILVCDSDSVEVQQDLRDAAESASENRHERIGVVGGDGDTVAQSLARAAAINSERVVLVAPNVLDRSGNELPAVFAAAAVAGAIAAESDPAIPLNGAPLKGLTGAAQEFTENEIDALVRGGVTPIESVAGVTSPIRGVTTRTTTAGAADTTWRELTTVLIADDVIPEMRAALRSKFARAKNTAQSRGAIRAQVIVELERKKTAQIIDDYGDVTVTADAEDPSVCQVEFSFTVAHGLNQIYLTAHITV